MLGNLINHKMRSLIKLLGLLRLRELPTKMPIFVQVPYSHTGWVSKCFIICNHDVLKHGGAFFQCPVQRSRCSILPGTYLQSAEATTPR